MASSYIHVFLPILLLCASISPIAPKCDLVHKECIRAHKAGKGLDVRRCVEILSADPEASKATNLKALTIVGLGLAENSAKKLLSQVDDTLYSGKISPELKPVITVVGNKIFRVYDNFKSAHGEVKDDNEFFLANYDIAIVGDLITAAQEELDKVKDKVDMSFFQRIFDELTAFRQINYVLTDDLLNGVKV